MHFKFAVLYFKTKTKYLVKFIRREQVARVEFIKRGSGWCELPEEIRSEIIPEKRAEITVGEPELSHVTGEMHCWMQ